jgi:hypothetical protein
VLEEIPTQGMTLADVATLKETVMNLMKQKILSSL